MLRSIILCALLVCALTHPMIRQPRAIDDEPSENSLQNINGTNTNVNGTDLDSRFGGHGGYGHGMKF